jgi:hypothetical protein
MGEHYPSPITSSRLARFEATLYDNVFENEEHVSNLDESLQSIDIQSIIDTNPESAHQC